MPTVKNSPEYKKATVENTQKKAEVTAKAKNQITDLRVKFAQRKLNQNTEATTMVERVESIAQKNKELVSCVDGVCDSGLTSKNIAE